MKTKIVTGLVLGSFIFASGALAASTYSSYARVWYSRNCNNDARGSVAAICDLRARVVALESEPQPESQKQLIVRDANGEYVGIHIDGLASGGTAYNPDNDQFLYFETNEAHENGVQLGGTHRYVYFTSTDCTGQRYAEGGAYNLNDRDIFWSGSLTHADSQNIFTPDTPIQVTPNSYFQAAVAGCQPGGSSSAALMYPVEPVTWTQDLQGPFTINYE